MSEDYSELKEEDLDCTNQMIDNDKFDFVLSEIKQYCDYHYLPFFKHSQTLILFEELLNIN
jgi:hypothetical protein